MSPTLNAFDNGNDTRATVLIFNIYGGNKRPDRPEGGFYVEETEQSKTLDSSSGLNPSANQGGVLIFTAQRVGEPPRIYQDITPSLLSRMGTGGNNTPMIVDPLYSFDTQFVSNANVFEDVSPTLKASQQSPSVFPIQGTTIGRQDHNGPGGPGFGQEGDPMYTLDTVSQHGVATNTVVRRLTPIECERLMGWPDNHTLHRADGKTNSDSTRYKMCGNGVATPVAQWIATQLKELL